MIRAQQAMATQPSNLAGPASARAVPRWASLVLAVAIVPAVACAVTFAWLGVTAAVAAGIGALAAAVVAVLLAGVACWPLAPADPLVDSTLDRDRRLSANAATAIEVLGPVAAEPGAVLTVSGPQRVRVAVELGLPLHRVRDLFLAGLNGPLDQALAGSAAVFHDTDGDRPSDRFASLSTTVPTRVGEVEVVPIRTDPGRGLYVHRVEEPEG